MWSYYGRKSKIIKYYPDPQYSTIIEPYAGTATYSLYKRNWENDIIILEKDEILYKIWCYLQLANENDIIKLPSLSLGLDLRTIKYLCDEEKWFMGFWINHGSSSPKNIVTKWAVKEGYWERTKLRVASSLYKIRHWKILLGSYADIPNQHATWFIDPPYQFGGKYYRYNNLTIDYHYLADWCINRNGQVIVCENTKANWLLFIPLCKLVGQSHITTEAMYVK